MKNIILSLTLILGLLIPSLSKSQSLIPDLPIEDAEDNPYFLPEVFDSGTNYLVEVYANWCGWCKIELIEWKDCYQDWKNNYNVEVLVLSTAGFDNKEPTVNFFESKDLEYPLYFGDQDTIMTYLDINAFPTNFLINSEGKIIDTLVGYRTCETMTESLSENFDLITATNDNISTKTENLQILKIGNEIMVRKEGDSELIDVRFYTMEGRTIAQHKKVWTEANIRLPDTNSDYLIVEVIGNQWRKAEILFTH